MSLFFVLISISSPLFAKPQAANQAPTPETCSLVSAVEALQDERDTIEQALAHLPAADPNNVEEDVWATAFSTERTRLITQGKDVKRRTEEALAQLDAQVTKTGDNACACPTSR